MGKFEQVEERLDEIKNDYGKIGVKALEEKYNASYSTIQRVLKKHNIIKGKLHQTKYKYINEHKDEFINDWVDGVLTIKELSKKYQCPETEIFSFARERSIKRKTLREKLDINSLINDWESKKMLDKEICEKYKISHNTLIKILEDNNIEDVGTRYGRKYFFNEKYFDEIDTEEKAYWLGFIYADGCHREKRYSLSISLKEEDKELLQKFYKCINCNKTIKKYLNKQFNKYYCNVLVQHPHLSETLKEKGVMGDKSFKITFPSNDTVPDNLKRHFIRGYFDGDGGISVPNPYYKISYCITGNYNFILSLKEYLLKNINGYTDTQIKKCWNSDVYKLVRGGTNQCQLFLDWIYKDANIYMKRKHDLYLDLLKYNEVKKYGKCKKD